MAAIEITYLKDLFDLMKSNKIVYFKSGALEIKLELSKDAVKGDSIEPQPLVENKHDEGQLPVDLRTDNLNNADTILNWSADTTHHEAEISGVNDMVQE